MPAPAPYRLIADELRTAILTGRLKPGDRVPGENTLMEQHGVAKETARRALATLAAEGLIETRRGSGTFVKAFRPIRRRGTKRLAQSQWGEGRSIWEADLDDRPMTTDRLEVGEVDCPPHVAPLLGLEPGARVVMRNRRYLVDGEPVMLAVSYLPAALAGGTRIAEADTGPGGVYARLAEVGAGPVWFREEVRVRMPLPEEAEALRLGPGSPVALIVRHAYAEGGRPVEVNEMTLDASRYLLEWEFPA
ncbi:GntR family transcriptional regulator [Peterkaempfera sp. SMS 1(5)a]|uniref:GntR family transcriptional regulator n=1 Tax=Peterkaempfera podocarpi TaxID=3232308 RepID=UPI003670EF15